MWLSLLVSVSTLALVELSSHVERGITVVPRKLLGPPFEGTVAWGSLEEV